jgi:glutaredoxin 3
MAVKIYSASDCPLCESAKNFFRRNKVGFKEFKVDLDSKAFNEMVDKSGQINVPVVELNGIIIVGYNEEVLKAALMYSRILV